MITRRTLLASAAACALPFRAKAEDLTTGEIIETATGKSLDFADLIDRLAEADTILIGERHGFAPHQDRVALILEELALRGRFPTLALEMLEPAQMAALESYRAKNPEYVGALGAALDWANSGWPSWHFYEPIFRAAFRARLEIVAAESDASDNPKISKELIESWKVSLDTVFCGSLSQERLGEMAEDQSGRDLAMAATLSKSDDAVLLVTGAGHARKDRIPDRLNSDSIVLDLSGTMNANMSDYSWGIEGSAPQQNC